MSVVWSFKASQFRKHKPGNKDLGNGFSLKTKLAQQLHLEIPIMFSAMSYGSISLNAATALARARPGRREAARGDHGVGEPEAQRCARDAHRGVRG